MELINKKKFFNITFNENIKNFMVHISFLSLKSKMIIHITQKVQIVLLLAKNLTALAKSTHFVNIFLKKLAKILPKQTNISKHAIEIVDDK